MKNIHKIKDNIYITSSDEEIKDWEWYIDDSNLIRKSIIWSTREDYNKVIITTDQYLINDGVQAIDDEFLEWFVKNPNCEKVDVEKFHGINTSIAEINAISGDNSLNWKGQSDLRDYKIIIPKEEPKQETMLESLQEYLKNTPKEKVLEDWDEFKHLDDIGVTVNEFLEKSKQETIKEVAERFYPPKTTDLICSPKLVRDAFIAGAKWQQETIKEVAEKLKIDSANMRAFNLGANWMKERMYSEEEVLTMLLIKHEGLTPEYVLEQFKKK